jgi:hypothetical protein
MIGSQTLGQLVREENPEEYRQTEYAMTFAEIGRELGISARGAHLLFQSGMRKLIRSQALNPWADSELCPCGKRAQKVGLCLSHYQQMAKYGVMQRYQ